MLCLKLHIGATVQSLFLFAILGVSSAYSATISMLDDVGRFKFVDTTTGIATVKKFGLDGYSNLAFNSSNSLFYLTDSQNMLRTITANGVLSNPLGQLPQVKGLAFDNTGSLFGYDFDLDELIGIDPTTASYTSIGPTGFTLDGPGSQLKFNGSQLMVLLDDNGLGTYGTIDPGTGVGTTLFQNSDYLGHRFTDIVPDGMGGMVSSDVFTVKGEDVYLLDPVTGSLDYIASIQNPVCDCVPEPTSLASFGLLTIALARKKRRQLVERISKWIGHHKRFKKIQTRRVFIESLEPRMLMTVTQEATGFGTTYSQSMGNFSLAPSAVQQANYSANTAVASNGMYGSSRLRHWFLSVTIPPIWNTFSSPGTVRIFVISDRPPSAVPSTFPSLGKPTKSHAKAANSFIEISREKRFGSAISPAPIHCCADNSSAIPMRMATDSKSPAMTPGVPSPPWPVTKPIVPPPSNAGAIATSLPDSQTQVNCSPLKFAATTRRSCALPSTPTTTKTIPTVP